MKSTILLLALFLVLPVLTACETHGRADGTGPRIIPQDFLLMGRGLSNNAVDLYDPSATSFNIPPVHAGSRPGAVSSIPATNAFVVRDPSVTIYSLDTIRILEPAPAPLPPLNITSADDSNLMTSAYDDEAYPP